MSWFPHFLSPLSGAIAASIVVPLLVLLYFLKLRRRPQPVPSTILWKKAIQDLQVNSPFQRLRRNLLLLLQLLLLAALLLALARPVMNYTPGAGQRTIILIDRSASMSATDLPHGRTRLDEAKRRADDLVDTLGRDGAAMIISFDDSAQMIQPFSGDRRILKSAIDSITPSDRRTKLEAAYRLADAQAAFTQGESAGYRQAPDIYLFSDGRASDADKATVQGNLHYEQVGTSSAKNIAVVAMNARRDYEQPTQVQVFARLANYGPDPVSDVQVQLSVDGVVRSVGSVNLLPEHYDDDQRKSAIASGFQAKDSIEFQPLEITDSAVVKVEQMNTDGDCLAADDSATVVVPPPKSLEVLLVTPGNWFLESGLSVQRIKTFDKMLPQDYSALSNADGGGKKLPKPYDVIVFDRDDDLKAKDVPVSGSAVYFDCVPPGLELKAAADTDGKEVIVADNDVLDWDREHPILRHLNISKLYVAHAIKLLPTLDSKVLIDGTNCPLLILHRENRAYHLVFAFDVIDSNLPLRPWFPAMLFQTLQFLSLGTDVELRPSYDPGVALRIPRSNLQKLGTIPDKITISGPAGSFDAKVPATGDFVLPALERVGLYTTNPPIPQYEKIAVSLLSPTESDLVPAPLAPGSGGQSVTVSVSGKSRMELWWWLVAAAIPVLLLEWWVYTRRVA